VLGLFVIKMFPCLNPDGVIIGNSRTGVEGADLNRVWQNPNPNLHPVIFGTLRIMEEVKKEREIEVFCDLIHTITSIMLSYMVVLYLSYKL
jgi:murein tripeptide amidase MpaA